MPLRPLADAPRARAPAAEPAPLRPRGPAKALDAAPGDYVVICISTYVRDLAKLDAMVAELKRRGITKANRSALIRFALDRVNLDEVPRGL